eukprot:scaffold51629_cov43-Prasinocladus_malaysianus.AAC.1
MPPVMDKAKHDQPSAECMMFPFSLDKMLLIDTKCKHRHTAICSHSYAMRPSFSIYSTTPQEQRVA